MLRCVAASQNDVTHMTQLLHQHRQEQQLALAEVQRKVAEVETSLSDRVDGLLATYNTKQGEIAVFRVLMLIANGSVFVLRKED